MKMAKPYLILLLFFMLSPPSILSKGKTVSLTPAREKKIQTLLRQQRFKAALKLISPLPSTSAEKDYYLGQAYLGTKKYSAAKRNFKRLLKGEFAHEARYFLGVIYFKEGKIKQATRYLKRAVVLSPEQANHKYRLLRQLYVTEYQQTAPSLISMQIPMIEEKKNLAVVLRPFFFAKEYIDPYHFGLFTYKDTGTWVTPSLKYPINLYQSNASQTLVSIVPALENTFRYNRYTQEDYLGYRNNDPTFTTSKKEEKESTTKLTLKLGWLSGDTHWQLKSSYLLNALAPTAVSLFRSEFASLYALTQNLQFRFLLSWERHAQILPHENETAVQKQGSGSLAFNLDQPAPFPQFSSGYQLWQKRLQGGHDPFWQDELFSSLRFIPLKNHVIIALKGYLSFLKAQHHYTGDQESYFVTSMRSSQNSFVPSHNLIGRHDPFYESRLFDQSGGGVSVNAKIHFNKVGVHMGYQFDNIEHEENRDYEIHHTYSGIFLDTFDAFKFSALYIYERIYQRSERDDSFANTFLIQMTSQLNME